MYLCVTAEAQRNHDLQERFTRYTMMNRNGMLTATGRAADAAAVAVSLQDAFPQASEVTGVMLPEGVASRTMTVGTDLLSSAPAIERPLCAISVI